MEVEDENFNKNNPNSDPPKIDNNKHQHKNQNKSNSKQILEKLKQTYPNKTIFSIAGHFFIIDEKYEFIKRLGQGAYGIVVSCLDKTNNSVVAMKKVENAFEDLIDAKRILRELRLLHFFNHPSIIKLIDIQKPENLDSFNDIYFATEFMDTDLHKVIYSKQPLTDNHFQFFIYQILLGVHYLHSAGVIHRDIKPSNILVNKDCEMKICDFGLCGKIKTEDGEGEAISQQTEYVVTRWYRAPEIILCPKRYTKAVDTWSVGCILAELLGRTALFPGDNYLDQIKKIIMVLGNPTDSDIDYVKDLEARKFINDLPKFDKIPFKTIYPKANPQAIDLLEKMLCFNPKQRISIEQCLEHPYFAEVRDKQMEIKSGKKFDWSFDNFELTKENVQKRVYQESLAFHP